ncbi:MAG: DUF2905 domain-containing protein [Deltaproteobacteria bacterium]|nr:DUF2905 domain-containing protein [Deltaproteobacteria bacterium]MBM4317413.1 DUF2905 domain-containing protein [Deltaproteobacteria bacterium]
MQQDFPFGKTLIVLGVFLISIGVFLLYGKEIPFINKLGKLPGDIKINKNGFSFYFPVTTSILVSALLTVISLIFRGLSK